MPLAPAVNGLNAAGQGGRQEETVHEKPFGEDWAVGCWNAQGLLTANCVRQAVKMRRAGQLVMHRDMLILTETHGNSGKYRARRLPRYLMTFWSNGEEGEAGVGSMVKKEFMRRATEG